MNESVWSLAASFATGLGLGVFFFGGLHWTLRKFLLSRYAGVLIALGFFIRMGCTLAAFYFVGHGEWPRLLTCLGGFILARWMIIHGSRVFDSRTA